MDQAALMASTTTAKTMADGTLRVTVDFLPKDAKQAFALFGSPGTDVALALLTKSAAVAATAPQAVESKAPIGPLCKLAVQFCSDIAFQQWFDTSGYPCDSEDDAKAHMLSICGITSRRELDTNSYAASIFHDLIRKPFMTWRDATRLF